MFISNTPFGYVFRQITKCLNVVLNAKLSFEPMNSFVVSSLKLFSGSVYHGKVQEHFNCIAKGTILFLLSFFDVFFDMLSLL